MEYQFVLVMAGLVGTAIAGSIWVGKLMNQIDINTVRLNKIEEFLNEVRVHDSETLSRYEMINYRISRLESHIEDCVEQLKKTRINE